MKIKAITLWQPWASLWAVGAKKYETRSWKTDYRGPIAIHAAKMNFNQALRKMFSDKEARNLFFDKAINCLRKGSRRKAVWLPYCSIIATAELVGCHRIYGHPGCTGWIDTPEGVYKPSNPETDFGDWIPGRYAWEITNIKILDTPIIAKGQQGLWNFNLTEDKS